MAVVTEGVAVRPRTGTAAVIATDAAVMLAGVADPPPDTWNTGVTPVEVDAGSARKTSAAPLVPAAIAAELVQVSV